MTVILVALIAVSNSIAWLQLRRLARWAGQADLELTNLKEELLKLK